jgi:hypothetical protein
MRLWHRSSMAILPLILPSLTAGILSCAPVQSGLRVWIDFRLGGFWFRPNTSVSVAWHAFARDGMAECRARLDGNRDKSPACPTARS